MAKTRSRRMWLLPVNLKARSIRRMVFFRFSLAFATVSSRLFRTSEFSLLSC